MSLSREETNRLMQQMRIVEMEEKVKDRRKKSILQIVLVMESLASIGKIPFEIFDAEFYSRTRTRFEDVYDEITNIDRSIRTIENIVEEVSEAMLEHTCRLENDDMGDIVFVMESRKTLTDVTQEVVKIIESPEKKTLEVTGRSRNRVQVTKLEQRPERREEVHLMFSRPYWPWLNDKLRSERLTKYLDFLHDAAQSPLDDRKICRKAKKLSHEFWDSSLRYFSHTLYLLQLLSVQRPDGFHIQSFKKEIKKIIPIDWQRIYSNHELSIDDFYLKTADLIEVNLIQPCDEENPAVFKVNRLIDFLEFHQIRDQQLSMIYQFVSSMSTPQTTKSIHNFMCDDFLGWKQAYNEKSGPDKIWEICVSEHKMFVAEYDNIMAKDHAFKIPLPMYFSFSCV